MNQILDRVARRFGKSSEPQVTTPAKRSKRIDGNCNLVDQHSSKESSKLAKSAFCILQFAF